MVPGIADKKNNSLPLWGNDKTMNLNNLILTNILSSHYFKINLYQLKTYHEVVDEIYYQVTHLEPWEKGSRKTSGQTGMCGGVRGVGAGGIVSTAFCILYKLFTLKLTRKQVVGLINHTDSAYIRGLGFMYIRYTQPPSDLWNWYSPYLEDEEELDVKAGGGQIMTVGDMLRHFLSKLEWFSTLFPRIPVPIQKDLESKLSEFSRTHKGKLYIRSPTDCEEVPASGDTVNTCLGNHIEDEESSARSSHEDYKTKEFDVDVKENKKEKESKDENRDSPDDYSRERQKRDKHGSTSKHHHSPERHKSHSSRARSRSPHDSKRHRSRHRESDKSDYHRNRDHSSYHKDSEPADYDKLYKDKRHERRDERSHSYGYDKRHNHSRNKY